MTSFLTKNFKPICGLRSSDGSVITIKVEDNGLPPLRVAWIEREIRKVLQPHLRGITAKDH